MYALLDFGDIVISQRSLCSKIKTVYKDKEVDEYDSLFAEEEKNAVKNFFNGIIETSAFRNAPLINVIIPSTTTTIGKCAFLGCQQLKSVMFNDGLINVDKQAFMNCISLTDIIIPNSVTEINDFAFAKCSSLKSVKLGTGITEINHGTFANCSSLSTLGDENSNASIQIPKTVTNIKQEAFRECTQLVKASIPETIKELGYGVFKECKGLKRAEIIGVKDMGMHCFFKCENLENILFPTSIRKIDMGTFAFCEKLTITYTGAPENWEEIEKSIWWNDHCTTTPKIKYLYMT